MEKATNLHFPFEIYELDPEEQAEINRSYVDPKDYVGVGPKKFKLLRRYCEDAANIYNMPLRSSDIFVVTYQRSGTTLSQELVWLIANDFDYATAEAVTLLDRYYFLEYFMLFDEKWKRNFFKKIGNNEHASAIIEKASKPITNDVLMAPSPRFIKTHLPMSLLPPYLVDTAKVVYVARDPRDVAVSSYHHARLFKMINFQDTFEKFWQLFTKDLFTLTPFFDHVKEAWALRHHPNMLFLFYEELNKDMAAAARRVADFLGKDVTPEQMSRLCDHLSIENFKNNHSVNFESVREIGLLASDEVFIRKGKSGGWHEYFDEEMMQQAEQWIADNLQDTDLRFP